MAGEEKGKKEGRVGKGNQRRGEGEREKWGDEERRGERRGREVKSNWDTPLATDK